MTSQTAKAESLRLLDVLSKQAGRYGGYSLNKLEDKKIVEEILSSLTDIQVEFTLAVFDSIARLCRPRSKENWHGYWNLIHDENYPRAGVQVVKRLLRRTLPFSTPQIVKLVDLTSCSPTLTLFSFPHLVEFVTVVERHVATIGRSPELDPAIQRMIGSIVITNAPETRLRKRLEKLLELQNAIPLEAGEVWADKVCADVGTASHQRGAWQSLLEHCQLATGSNPSSKWIKAAQQAVFDIGEQCFVERVSEWFTLVSRPRTRTTGTDFRWIEHEEWYICDGNSDILKGLVWCCGSCADADPSCALTALALTSYKKVPGVGPRLVKVGNACIWALSQMPGKAGLHQLALLKVRVKFGTAQKMIEKALDVTAQRIGLPREELEEMAVPAYGMSEVGVRRDELAGYMAELAITPTGNTELRWLKPDGKRLMSVPAPVKKECPDDLKELRQADKDIQKMLGAQRERIDSLFLQRKSWPYPVWRERYLDHPLVGTLARRLIWQFTRGEKSDNGIWLDDRIISRESQPLTWLDSQTQVELWHPITQSVEAIQSWRAWLEERQIQQPIKQAHREVYPLTVAERRTETYSNRFAAHVLRQHQFSALCAGRGWKNKLRLMVDAEYPPASRYLPQWNLRAEFWIEGIGTDYGTDTNDAGVYLRLSTDQVRFYPVDGAQRSAHAGGGGYHPGRDADQPLPLEQIPPLVFSEIMRDVDLFVGVSSVGNDPTWADGGPQGRFREYWNTYSFGELAESAKTRLEILKRIVPRLKIASRCSFSERFLIVRGDRRTYKIHLGSGNILMEPNDQYLCIVKAPAREAKDAVFLPFEGDNTLALILSKAFLLAEDTKITDPTIVRQIAPN